jgi:hypothetical protein
MQGLEGLESVKRNAALEEGEVGEALGVFHFA